MDWDLWEQMGINQIQKDNLQLMKPHTINQITWIMRIHIEWITFSWWNLPIINPSQCILRIYFKRNLSSKETSWYNQSNPMEISQIQKDNLHLMKPPSAINCVSWILWNQCKGNPHETCWSINQITCLWRNLFEQSIRLEFKVERIEFMGNQPVYQPVQFVLIVQRTRENPRHDETSR